MEGEIRLFFKGRNPMSIAARESGRHYAFERHITYEVDERDLPQLMAMQQQVCCGRRGPVFERVG